MEICRAIRNCFFMIMDNLASKEVEQLMVITKMIKIMGLVFSKMKRQVLATVVCGIQSNETP